MHYVVAYDICDPRRLRRVARTMEKYAVRCQKSVFIFQGTRAALGRLLDEVGRIMSVQGGDIVQAWPVAAGTSANSLSRGKVPCLFPEVAIVDNGQLHVLENEA